MELSTTSSSPRATANNMRLEVAAATDVGRRRKANADAVLVDEAAGFFAVSDGMGDTPRSGIVAQMALDAVREMFLPPWSLLPPAERWAGEAAERLRLGVLQANGRLYVKDRAQRLGTTFAGAVVCANSHLCVGNVGDSRVYVCRPSTARLARLTEDDTVLNEALWRGVPYDTAAELPDAQALTRAVGTRPAEELRPRTLRWAPGDVLLACTDGLTDQVEDENIKRVLLMHAHDLVAAAHSLIEHSTAAGGMDNVSIVLVRWAG